MSQGILTNAGRDLFAAKQGAGQPLVIDRFLLANIPGLDPLTAADPDEALPVVGNRVAELAVTNSGYVNADKVVYSLYLGTLEGDYTFNWVGLLADDNTLVAVRYIDPVNKYATAGQSLGNAITRNFLVTYTDAQAITNITVDAATWQLNFDNASETAAGLAEIATQGEVDSGTDDERFVTPKKGAARYYHPGNPQPIPPPAQTGDIISRASANIPSGWLECNGAALSRTTYADLFAEIGTTYGVGDGSTTFNIPDLRGEFIRGWDNGRGVDPARAIASFQADEFKAHNHEVRDRNLYALNGTSHASAAGAGNLTGNNTQNTGGSETRPRNVAMMYCIKY